MKALQDAREALLVTDDIKKQFLSLASRVAMIYRAILPDSSASQFAPACALYTTLADMIRALLSPVDISGVMQQIESVLDKSIGASGYAIKEDAKLRAMITAKLQDMVAQNRTRVDFLEKFQDLIDEYNAGSANIDEIFEQLLQFAKKLNEEAQRHVREELTEDELAIFDILTKPRLAISPKEEKAVKKVARDMLATLKAKALVLDWRKRQQSRAAVRVCIEEWLDKLPEAYTSELYQEKCAVLYQHVYDMYGTR